MEGTSAARNSGSSTPSGSESSYGYESTIKPHASRRNRRCIMPTKAIHPLLFPSRTTHDPVTPRRDLINFSRIEAPDSSDYDLTNRSGDCFRCCLCERFLSQRSPWGSRRIIKSEDMMPVSGVLACRHVFHAECLDQTTPKARKNDPPCPVCVKIEEESFSKLRNGFPRVIKPFFEDPLDKPWGCAQAGDCIEGAFHAPSKNALMPYKFRKNISPKGNSTCRGLEFPGRARKSGSFLHGVFVGSVEHGSAGSSRTTGDSCLK